MGDLWPRKSSILSLTFLSQIFMKVWFRQVMLKLSHWWQLRYVLYQIVHTCLIIAITLFKRVVLYVVVVVVLFYNAVDFFYPFPFPLVKLCSCCVASGVGGAWAQ